MEFKSTGIHALIHTWDRSYKMASEETLLQGLDGNLESFLQAPEKNMAIKCQ